MGADSAGRLIAEVSVETSLVHLDKSFDYLIPEALAPSVHIGSRVRVRFAGSLSYGWVVGIKDASLHPGRLLPLQRVPGSVPPLSAEVAAVARLVAARYAGTFTDVLRAAVPARHAAAENAFLADDGVEADVIGIDQRERDASETSSARDPERCVWVVPAGTDHWRRVAQHVLRARERGGVIAVLPDAADVTALAAALARESDASDVAVLTAESGPAKRWRAFLRARAGQARIVIGTRSAVFAPVPDLAEILVWDDGDESHREPHAPYWHVREVAVIRSAHRGCAITIAGRSVSVEAAALINSGWMTLRQPTREILAQTAPLVRAAIDDSDASARDATAGMRMPSLAMSVIRESLARGSVLISVPRRGFVPVLACAGCRRVARCEDCGAGLGARSAQSAPACSRCGWAAWSGCRDCGGHQLRAVRIGSERTAEEIGRAFPSVPVVMSNGDHRVIAMPRKPSIVVATHGCEPCEGQPYAAVVIVDVLDVINRPSLNAGADAMRRFSNALNLAAPSAPVIIAADGSVPLVQALIRRDPAGWAARELAERQAAHMPPAALMFSLTGSLTAVPEFIRELQMPEPHKVLGPMPVAATRDADAEEQVRAYVTVPKRHARDVVAKLRETIGIRGARKEPFVRVVVDPADI